MATDTRLTPQEMCIGVMFLLPMLAFLIYYHWDKEVAYHRESQAVQTAFSTAEIPDPHTLSPELDGKPVHLTGTLETSDRLRDSVTGMEENALMLQRNVSYWQWSEIRHSHTHKVYNPSTGKDETETYYTYTYEKRWRDHQISAAKFNKADARKKYRNTAIAVCRPSCLFSKTMHIGAYRIPEFLAETLKQDAAPLPVRLDDSLRSRFESSLRKSLAARSETNASAARWLKAEKLVHIEGNTLYYGADPANPEVGDMRITYSIVRPGAVYSLVAAAKGDTFEGITSPGGKELASMKSGTLSSEDMMGSAASTLSWDIMLERTLLIAGYMIFLLIFWLAISDYTHTGVFFPVVFGVLGGHSLLLLVMGLAGVNYEPASASGAIMLTASAALALLTIFIGIKTAPNK